MLEFHFFIARHQTVVPPGITGSDRGKLKLAVQLSVRTPRPAHHGHDVVFGPRPPQHIPDDFLRGLRVVFVDIREGKTPALKSNQHPLLVYLVPGRNILAPVFRGRVGPGFRNLHIHAVIEVVFPGRLGNERLKDGAVFEAEMLSGSQLGLRAGVLNPVPQRVIALVPRRLHGRGRRTEPQHGYQKYKTDRFRQRAPLHEWSLLFMNGSNFMNGPKLGPLLLPSKENFTLV